MGMNVGTTSSSGDDEVMMDINTTPLIDVMLVLLIMFIITIPIQTHAVKMNMPVPSNAAPAAVAFAFDMSVGQRRVAVAAFIPFRRGGQAGAGADEDQAVDPLGVGEGPVQGQTSAHRIAQQGHLGRRGGLGDDLEVGGQGVVGQLPLVAAGAMSGEVGGRQRGIRA